MKSGIALLFCSALAYPVNAQNAAVPVVRVTGDAVYAVKPDLARIDIGVVTQAPTAGAAAGENAKRVDAVIREIKQVLGTAGEVKTVQYSVSPEYRYPERGGKPTITGYNATNIVQATTGDLTRVGKLIDATTALGANEIRGIQFTLKDETAAQKEALKQAIVKARGKADAMAAALGTTIRGLVSVEEGGAQVRPLHQDRAMMMRAAAEAAPTPIESGNVEVRATVTLTAEINPSR